MLCFGKKGPTYCTLFVLLDLIRISLVLSYAPGLLVLTVGTHKAENFTRKASLMS